MLLADRRRSLQTECELAECQDCLMGMLGEPDDLLQPFQTQFHLHQYLDEDSLGNLLEHGDKKHMNTLLFPCRHISEPIRFQFHGKAISLTLLLQS